MIFRKMRIQQKLCVLISITALCTLCYYLIMDRALLIPDYPTNVTVIRVAVKNVTQLFRPFPSNFAPSGRLSNIRSAFLVSNNQIRLSIVQPHKLRKFLYYKYGNIVGKITTLCHQPTCLDFYSKPCSMIGFIGFAKIKYNPEIKQLYFSRKKNDFHTPIDIVDVRPKESYDHVLGVCVQAVYLHSDYTLFVQFFEYWLDQGATIFYIYYESFSNEVLEIIKFYQRKSNVSISLVEWSQLLRPPNQRYNPNEYMYRLEMMLSIFDCIHRSRTHAKFVVQTDLDELVYISSGQTVRQFLEDYSVAHPRFASLQLQSQRIRFQSDEHNVTSPHSVSFNELQNVSIEIKPFDPPYYSKIMYRPERVVRVHAHKQLTPERDENNKLYQNLQLNVTDGVILHVRRSENANFKWKETESTDILAPYIERWAQNLKNRLKGYTFAISKWSDNGLQILAEVERCRNLMKDNKDTMCHSVALCETILDTNYPGHFIHANNSWVAL